YSYTDCMNTKNGNFFYDETYLSEDEFVKNFGNKFAQVHFTRQRVFIEESENSISLKAQYYHKWRNVGQRFFVVRKNTHYFSFNFKTKMFYSGVFKGKNKQRIGNTMKINPSFRVLRDMDYSLKIDDSIRTESYFYFFLEKIWDRLGLENPQNFETKNPFTHYSLTKYLINGVKIPNNWIQYTDTFVPIKTLRSCNMNLVDGLMKLMKLKGSKVKRILNKFEYVNFDRLTGLYHLLGIDRFNKLPDKIFDYQFSNDRYGHIVEENPAGGQYWYCMSEDYQKDFRSKLPHLTSKEKDRILYLSEHLDYGVYNTLIEHLHFKKKLLELGEDVKLRFENRSQFNEEHEEFSRLLTSYSRGEIERYYGEIDSLESPILYQGETYYPVLLKKTIDYEKESQHQRNCVRTYAERPDCIIFSIRKGSDNAEERITVEYRFTKNEILNVQERARFNEIPNETFSEVAKIQLANINLLYKIGTLKLPKMIKTYRSGKVI
ncbi:MAG: hypothetical protein EBS55_12885, partial [Flavobacteriaceae bacterium]|nr:hypothetical protein [Flavobacteriaceae bacterium]